MEKYVECPDNIRIKMKKHSAFVLLPYCIIWLLSVAFFWLVPQTDAVGYSVIVVWLLIPLITLITSFVTGFGNYFGKLKWLLPFLFGVMYMLLTYCTFSMANSVAFHKVNPVDLTMLPSGVGISLLGIIVGIVIRKIRK